MQKRRERIEKWRLEKKKELAEVKPEPGNSLGVDNSCISRFSKSDLVGVENQKPAKEWTLEDEDEEEEADQADEVDKTDEADEADAEESISRTEQLEEDDVDPLDAYMEVDFL